LVSIQVYGTLKHHTVAANILCYCAQVFGHKHKPEHNKNWSKRTYMITSKNCKAAKPKHSSRSGKLLSALPCMLIIVLTSGLSTTSVWAGVQPGTLVVQKEVLDGEGNPNNPDQTFSLRLLDDNGDVLGSASVEAGDAPLGLSLAPGNYGVGETNLAQGWSLDNISCSSRDGNSTFGDFTPGDTTLDVQLGDGDRVLCTFTNSFMSVGTLLVQKEVLDGEGNPNNPNQTFNMRILNENGIGIAGATVTAGDSPVGLDFATGNYGVTETDLAQGWSLDNISCISRDGNSNFCDFTPGDTTLDVQLGGGDRVLCTFTNSFTNVIFIDGFEGSE
jgi:hypothetical protein